MKTDVIDHTAMIDINTVDLRKLIQAVYSVSMPTNFEQVVALKNGELTEEEIAAILDLTKDHPTLALDMDVVKGRACRMQVYWAEEGRMEIPNYWPDHDYALLLALLANYDIHIEPNGEHSEMCQCRECKPNGKVLFSSPCCGKESCPIYLGEETTFYRCPCGHEWKP